MTGGISSILSFILKFSLLSNSVIPVWKLFVSEFLLGIPETLRCSSSAPHVQIVPALIVRQLLIVVCRDVDYLQLGTFFSTIYYNMFNYYYYYYYLDVITLISKNQLFIIILSKYYALYLSILNNLDMR
jgi:hypothetical protein